MATGALMAFWLSEITIAGSANKIAACITGIGVGGVAGVFNEFSGKIVRWLDNSMLKGVAGRSIVDGIAGGIAGYLAYFRISQFVAFPLSPNSSVVAGIGTGIAGIFNGIIIGCIIGTFVNVITTVFMKIIRRTMPMMYKTVSFTLSPILIISRFRRILCNHCFRHTAPLKSQYKDGIRYCEHCQQTVDDTTDPGQVICLFGDMQVRPTGRAFILSNPDFEIQNYPIEISTVYLAPINVDQRLFERFITYIVNYPPKSGVRSVKIFYQGELDNLGDNLKHALHNTFVY